MAKHTITHTCGHTVVKSLYGSKADRQREIKREQSRLCLDCYRQQQLEQAAAVEATQGLPELEGSEKQVSWARQIRTEAIELFERMVAEMPANVAAGYRERLNTLLATETDAGWWIDNRGGLVLRLLDQM